VQRYRANYVTKSVDFVVLTKVLFTLFTYMYIK